MANKDGLHATRRQQHKRHAGIPDWLENSPEDEAADKREAKARGMSVGAYEGSAADESADRRLMKRMRHVRSTRKIEMGKTGKSAPGARQHSPRIYRAP